MLRKQSIERDMHQQQHQQHQQHSMHQQTQNTTQFYRGSPAVDSGAGSSRSDSPHSHQQLTNSSSRASTSQYSPSPCPSQFSDAPPPPPPRCSSTPSTPPPIPTNLQQHIIKRLPQGPPGMGGGNSSSSSSRVQLPLQSPTGGVPSGQSPARGTSPVSSSASTTSSIVLNGIALSNGVGGSRQPIIVQNGPQAQQQLSQQMQALSLYQSGATIGPPPPSYTASIQSRQSPTQSTITVATSSAAGSDYRKSPSSGIYSATSTTGSPSPITVSGQQQPTPPGRSPMPRPIPLSACGSRQTKTQQPIIMQSVKSTQVQKPVLQTATAPTAGTATGVVGLPSPQQATSPLLQAPAPPSYALSIQQKTGLGSASSSPTTHLLQNGYGKPNNMSSKTPSPPPPVPSSSSSSSSPVNLSAAQPMVPPGKKPEAVHGMKSPLVPNTEPPSYASTMQAILAQQQLPQTVVTGISSPVNVVPQAQAAAQAPPRHHLPPPPPYSTNTKGGELQGRVDDEILLNLIVSFLQNTICASR